METKITEQEFAALILFMEPARLTEYSRRLERDACFIEMPQERFVAGRPITYWGACVTHRVVADIGHHVARGGSSD